MTGLPRRRIRKTVLLHPRRSRSELASTRAIRQRRPLHRFQPRESSVSPFAALAPNGPQSPLRSNPLSEQTTLRVPSSAVSSGAAVSSQLMHLARAVRAARALRAPPTPPSGGRRGVAARNDEREREREGGGGPSSAVTTASPPPAAGSAASTTEHVVEVRGGRGEHETTPRAEEGEMEGASGGRPLGGRGKRPLRSSLRAEAGDERTSVGRSR